VIYSCEVHGFSKEDNCPACNEKNKIVLDDEQEKTLGQFVSGALRHFPENAGLSMYSDGWVSYNALMYVCSKRYRWFKKEHMNALLQVDKNRRYEKNGGKIRARYGHSVDIVLNYPDYTLPKAYYGVSEEELDVVLENGLKPIKQKYVHLSMTVEKAYEVCVIHTEKPIVLTIDAAKLMENGYKVMQANEEIVLTGKIPPNYIKKTD